MEELKKIILELKEAMKEANLVTSSDSILDAAVRIYIERQIANRPRYPSSQAPRPEEPATEKQKNFMAKLGIVFAPEVTKREAARMINQKMGEVQ